MAQKSTVNDRVNWRLLNQKGSPDQYPAHQIKTDPVQPATAARRPNPQQKKHTGRRAFAEEGLVSLPMRQAAAISCSLIDSSFAGSMLRLIRLHLRSSAPSAVPNQKHGGTCEPQRVATNSVASWRNTYATAGNSGSRPITLLRMLLKRMQFSWS